MKTIFYSKDAQFELTDEEYQKSLPVWDEGRKCFISRLNVSLSPLYIWAGQKPIDDTKRILHDGTRAINKFGQWYLENNPDIKIDERYYPELLKDLPNETTKNLENSEFHKIIMKKFPE